MNVRGNIEEFRVNVNDFTDIENRIKELNEKIKPLADEIRKLKQKKIDLKNNICEFMEVNDWDQCALQEKNSILVHRKRRTMVSVTKEVIKNELCRFFLDPKYNAKEFALLGAEKKAEKLYDFIYGEREYKYTNILQQKKYN